MPGTMAVMRNSISTGKEEIDASPMTNVAETDLVKKSGGRLYPFEIKLCATPTFSMASHFTVLGTSEMGKIICMSEKKTILGKNLPVMPISLV